MSDNTYNGWSNYATWRVNLELVEDHLTMYANDMADGEAEKFESYADLADYLKQYVEDAISEPFSREEVAPLTESYAMAFVGEVDYWQIAKHWDELVE